MSVETYTDHPPLIAFIKTGRIRGTLYTFLFTIAGFALYSDTNMPWTAALFSALACSLVHMSIMTFNDWCDREHDLQKGKRLAHDHPEAFLLYWRLHALVTLLALSALAVCDYRVAIFCIAVLVLGLVYSYVDHIMTLNNLIVAICGASPVLCGSVHFQNNDFTIWKWYGIFFFLILAREIIKDIEDVAIDGGYKNTFAVHFGSKRAKAISISLTAVAAFLIAITKKAKEGLIFLAVLVYKFVRWDPTSICKRMIILYDTLLALLVIFLAVPNKYGYRETAMLDFWSLEHLFWGVVMLAFFKRRFPKWSITKHLVLIAGIAYSWELIEYSMELGIFGDAISAWKKGFEHWSNRCVADPLLALIGAYIQLNWSSAWKWVISPWILWGMLNYLAADSIAIQKAILEFLA